MSEKNIKAVFFDIDGTLAAVKTHIIPDSARDAICRLREKKICCILSTGRHPLEVEEENILPGLFFDGGISAAISFLRTLVFQTGAVLFLPLLMGIDGVWWAVTVAEVMASLISVVFLIAKRKKYHY